MKRRRRKLKAQPLVPNETCLLVSEMRRILRISVPHAYRMIQIGQVPSIRVGKKLLIPRAALMEFIARTKGPTDGGTTVY